jgi:hypothetical protein
VTTDEEFAESIADTVALVARGDIAAFVIPGQLPLDAKGAQRFGVIYAELARAAVAHQRNLVLRWVFDPPGSADALKCSEPNAQALLRVLAPYAVAGRLPDSVRLEFAQLGAVSTALQTRLAALGVACN